MAQDETPRRPDGRPRLRIGDADRQRMIDELRRHMGAGRLDMAEYERRVEQAAAAVYDDDLAGLLDDLPRSDGEPDATTDRSARRDARRSRSAPWSREPRRRSSGWSRPNDGGRRPAWRSIPRPVLIAVVVTLAIVTHWWFLLPLFLVLGARGRGGCVGHRRPPRGHNDQWRDERPDPRGHAAPGWPDRAGRRHDPDRDRVL